MAVPAASALDPAWPEAVLRCVAASCDTSLGEIQDTGDIKAVLGGLERLAVSIRKVAQVYRVQGGSALIQRDLAAVQARGARAAYRALLLLDTKANATVSAYLRHCEDEYATSVDATTGASISADDHPVTIGFRPLHAPEEQASDIDADTARQQPAALPTAPATDAAGATSDIRDLCQTLAADKTGTSLVVVLATAGTGKTWLCR